MNASFTADKPTLLLIDHQVGTMQLIKNIAMGDAKRTVVAPAKMTKMAKSAGTEQPLENFSYA